MRVKSEENISVCKLEAQELQVMLSKGKKQYNDTQGEILQNQKTLMDRIQEHFDSLLKDGGAQWHLTRETINRELELIHRNIQQMEEQKNTIDQILNPHQNPEILTSNVSPIPKILPSNTVYQMSF